MTSTGFVLGYGSWCRMRLRYGASSNLSGGTATGYYTVLMTGGNYTRTMTVPTQRTFSTPFSSEKRGVIRSGMGVYAYAGSLSFDLTNSVSSMILSQGFFTRNSFLDLILCDGEGRITLPGCVWNSLSISANPNALVTCSLGFLSCNGYRHDIIVDDAPTGDMDLGSPELAPYWKYGGEGMQGFSLNISRSVTPMYLNQRNWIGPSYLRVGHMNVSFSVTCWQKWFDHREIVLGSKKIVFNASAFQNERSYTFGSAEGESSKTYTNTAVSLNSYSELFSIV